MVITGLPSPRRREQRQRDSEGRKGTLMALVGSFFVGAFIDPNVIAHFTRVLSPGVFFPIYKKRHLAKMDLRVAPSAATVFQMCPAPLPTLARFHLVGSWSFLCSLFCRLGCSAQLSKSNRGQNKKLAERKLADIRIFLLGCDENFI